MHLMRSASWLVSRTHSLPVINKHFSMSLVAHYGKISNSNIGYSIVMEYADDGDVF